MNEKPHHTPEVLALRSFIERTAENDRVAEEALNLLRCLEEQLEVYRSTLERIAEVADRRPDGTFNFGRNALRQWARDALASSPASKQEDA